MVIGLGIVAIAFFIIDGLDRQRPAPLSKVIRGATHVYLETADGQDLAGVSRKFHPEIVTSMHGATSCHTHPQSASFDQVITVIPQRMESFRDLKFNSRTGEMGSGHEWCYVTQQVCAWALTAKAPGSH